MGSAVKEAGGLSKLVDRLVGDCRGGNMDVKEKAAMFLASLSEQLPFEHAQISGDASPLPPEHATLIVKAGGIHPLVELVAPSSSTAAQLYACNALASVSRSRDAIQEAIVAADGVPRLSACLRSGGDIAVKAAAAACMASVSELRSAASMCVSAGAIPSLVALLKQSATYSEAAVHASWSLGNLARTSAEVQTLIGSAGGLEPLVASLDNGKAQAAAAYALGCLAHDHPSNQATIVTLGGAARLIAMLSVVSVETQANAARALAAMASGGGDGEDPQVQDAIRVAGGVRPLLALIESRYPHAQLEAVAAFAMLAKNNPANQDAIAEAGGLPPLVGITQWPPATVHPPEAQVRLAPSSLPHTNSFTPPRQTALDARMHTGGRRTRSVGALPCQPAQSGRGGEHTGLCQPRGAAQVQRLRAPIYPLPPKALVPLHPCLARPCLAHTLRYSRSLQIEMEVARAITVMTDGHVENRTSLAEAGAITALLPLLHADAAYEHAAVALATLARGNPRNQEEVHMHISAHAFAWLLHLCTRSACSADYPQRSV